MRNPIVASCAALAGALCLVSPAYSQTPPATEQRELIYCADQMTHEEREAYRANMRAASSTEEKAAIRQAHQQEMRARAKQRGDEALCEPVRLRQRQGRGQ